MDSPRYPRHPHRPRHLTGLRLAALCAALRAGPAAHLRWHEPARLLLLRLVTRHRLGEMRRYGMPRSAITHRIDVRRHAAQKRAALATHQTSVSGRGRVARLYRALIRLPLPIFRIACGTEWFAEPGGRTGDLVARKVQAVTTRKTGLCKVSAGEGSSWT
jgi:hypothetical protein